jgi:hypothetical protein
MVPGEDRGLVDRTQVVIDIDALSGEGLDYVALGQPRRALEAFERAVAVHPHLEGARRNAELLRKYLATLERRSL